jgi:hypothetical protein
MRRHLKGTAGSRTCLFKDQGDVLSPVHILCQDPFFLFILQIRRKIEQIQNLLRRVVQQLQKASSL